MNKNNFWWMFFFLLIIVNGYYFYDGWKHIESLQTEVENYNFEINLSAEYLENLKGYQLQMVKDGLTIFSEQDGVYNLDILGRKVSINLNENLKENNIVCTISHSPYFGVYYVDNNEIYPIKMFIMSGSYDSNYLDIKDSYLLYNYKSEVQLANYSFNLNIGFFEPTLDDNEYKNIEVYFTE